MRAKQQILRSHCGFSGPLPMVCCMQKTEKNYENEIQGKIVQSKMKAAKMITELQGQNTKQIKTLTDINRKRIAPDPGTESTALTKEASTTQSKNTTSKLKTKNRNAVAEVTTSSVTEVSLKANILESEVRIPVTKITRPTEDTKRTPITTRKYSARGFKTTPFTTPSSVLRSNFRQLESPQWSFFRIGF